MSKTKQYVKREWLNTSKSYNNGWIKSSAMKDRWDKKDHWSVDIHIADCSRQVCLDLARSKGEQSLPNIRKLDKIITHLQDLRAYLVENT